MKICNTNHDEVAYDCEKCPVCNVIEKSDNTLLIEKIDKMKKVIDDLYFTLND
jgi:uncharacterized protein (DUF1499 family)